MAATVRALDAKQELTRNQQQLALINSCSTDIAHVNAEGLYTHSNGWLYTIFLMHKIDIVGRSLKAVPGDHAWSHVRPSFKTALSGDPRVSEFRDEESGSSRVCTCINPA